MEHDLARAQETLGDRERPDHVVSHDTTGISNDVSLAFGKAEQSPRLQSGIHARDDRDLPCRGHGQASLGEAGHILSVVAQVTVDCAHPLTPCVSRPQSLAENQKLGHSSASPRLGSLQVKPSNDIQD